MMFTNYSLNIIASTFRSVNRQRGEEYKTRGQSNLTKSASRGGPFPG